MKGIILAGGTGSRLWPITKGVSKQLLPVYDKPLIHYPLSTLMMTGIREIVIVTTPKDLGAFQTLLGDGQGIGISIEYVEQIEPKGIAEAFILAEKQIENEKTCLILGDNIFHGVGLGTQLNRFTNVVGAQIFGYRVSNPSDYGVAEFDRDGNVISIVEKPLNPRTNIAIPGIYFYDENVLEYANELKPSNRNELEITDLNRIYLEKKSLNIQIFPRGTAWLDTGTFNSLHDASSYIRALEERQGSKISCIEEIAFRNGWISAIELEKIALQFPANNFGKYLLTLIDSSNPFSW